MATFRSTAYTEHAPDSPNEKWGIGSSSMQRMVDLVDGSFLGRLQAAYDFLGYAVVVNSGSVDPNGQPYYYISRIIPMAYPGLAAANIRQAPDQPLPAGILPPDLTNRFYAIGISRTEPLGQPRGVNAGAVPGGTAAAQYVRARLTLDISTLPYFILSDAQLIANGGTYNNFPDEGIALANNFLTTRYINRQREPFSRIIKIPYGIMQGAPNAQGQGKLGKIGIPFREGGSTYHYTWMRVPLEGVRPGADFGRIGGALGTINSKPFDGNASQTMYFDSYSTREYQGAFGEWLADVRFTMIYLPHNSSGARLAAAQAGGKPLPANADGKLLTKGVPTGWNYIVDVDASGNWDYYPVSTAVVSNGVIVPGQPPFQTSDFSTLFHP